ncbi:MAG: hypothetical protein ABI053_09280 [Lacisediminihabitans sp.]
MDRTRHAQKVIEVGPGLSVLAERLRARLSDERRFMLGFCGAPGSGKSTLAAALVSMLGATSVVVPMDGFHIATAALATPDQIRRRAAIDTFDVFGCLAILERLSGRTNHDAGAVIYAPGFDHDARLR